MVEGDKKIKEITYIAECPECGRSKYLKLDDVYSELGIKNQFKKARCHYCDISGLMNKGEHKPKQEITPKPVQWSPDGYPIFTDPAQFQAWEKQKRLELIEEIQDAFNEKAVARLAELVDDKVVVLDKSILEIETEVKRLGNAIEKFEEYLLFLSKCMTVTNKSLVNMVDNHGEFNQELFSLGEELLELAKKL